MIMSLSKISEFFIGRQRLSASLVNPRYLLDVACCHASMSFENETSGREVNDRLDVVG